MQVKNLKTGEFENMRHGPATDAVTAGTHVFINLDENEMAKSEKGKATSKSGDKN